MEEIESFRKGNQDEALPSYEYCTNCDANLTLQKGYDHALPYWVCRGCGQMLINPNMEWDAVWRCDRCGSLLNVQPGFSEDCGEWGCAQCGYVNRIDEDQLYLSEDEYEAEQRNPLKGLSPEAVLQLSLYEEQKVINERGNAILVRNREDGQSYVWKYLEDYDRSIYSFIKDHPIAGMPKLYAFFEGDNGLIVIEEYIEGKTVLELVREGALTERQAVRIATDLCRILNDLHNLSTPIIHRDIKPSNVIVTPEGKTILLDMNIARWYDPAKKDDTKYMGTQNYASPEQVGFGLTASSERSDIYALGVMLNVMLTGRYPKEKMPSGRLSGIIARCIRLEAKDRYTARELLEELSGWGLV